MKVTVVLGARKNGNTAEVVRYFQEQLSLLGDYQFANVFLEDCELGFCTGCHSCIFLGEDRCPHHREVKTIEDQMLDSDVVILATPGYMFSVTGIMKNFLDHVAYNCHRPKYFGKTVFLLSSCTSWQAKGVFSPMRTWGSASGFQFGGQLYVEMLPFPLSEEELTKRRRKIREAAIALDKRIRQAAVPKPRFGELMVFRAFRTLCKLAPQIFVADLKYFSERKAYDKGTNWYIDAKVSPLAKLMANYAERRMARTIDRMIDKNKMSSVRGAFRNRL